MILLRFDRFLLIFDICKAFLSIGLNECDQNRLMCLWYNNIEEDDYSIVAFRSRRLSFGLRCSPALLMLALYKMLVLDDHEEDSVNKLARAVYNTIYMDNGSFSCNDNKLLKVSFEKLITLFAKYKFSLQQFYTNDVETQKYINKECNVNDDCNQPVKLFGLTWHRDSDTLSPVKPYLDKEADTKRKILSSLNAIYDIMGIYIPILLRARLFVQKLQTDNALKWDTKIPAESQREWTNVCKQVNAVPVMQLNRFVGERTDEYELIAFSDASRDACGCVIYLKSVKTNSVSYLQASSKLFGANMKKKSIPCLEIYAVYYGVEHLVDTYDSLAGESIVSPIKIVDVKLFTDSMVCIHWMNSYVNDFDKLRGMSVFVKNKIRKIDELCTKFSVTFRHTAGQTNPADCTTKPYSPKALSKLRYYDGPSFLVDETVVASDVYVVIPNPQVDAVDEVQAHTAITDSSDRSLPPAAISGQSQANDGVAVHQCDDEQEATKDHLIPTDKYSSFNFLVNVYKNVIKFVDKLKCKIKSVPDSTQSYRKRAIDLLISREQKTHFPEVFDYFKSPKKRNLPPIVSRMNLYVDSCGVIRVKSKFGKNVSYNPILMPKKSALTDLVIVHVHERLAHAGLYAVLREIRREFYILHYFSVIRRVLKSCVICRRLNERPIKLNQSNYRSFRTDPNQIAFRDLFLDFAGPYSIKLCGQKRKVWLLIITCTWSRAVNLKVCLSANTQDFIRAIQLHIYDHGMFTLCVSDLGSQIQCGTSAIEKFLNDVEFKEFLETNGAESLSFQNYPKGNSSLGSMVECCVKQVKHLIQKSIRTLVLDYFDFSFLVEKAISLINKRPIAFKSTLRSLAPDEIPQVITPEMIIRGYETMGVNVVPELHIENDDDDNSPTYSDLPSHTRLQFSKMNKARSNLLEVYHREFLCTLVDQAVDKCDRYKPVLHKMLRVGDIVLLVEKTSKRYMYPMGRVVEVQKNDLGEVTAAYIVKGATRERVYRHASSLILLLSAPDEAGQTMEVNAEQPAPDSADVAMRQPRRAALMAKEKISAQAHAN